MTGRGAVCGGAERCGAYGVVWCCVVWVECAFCALFVTGGVFSVLKVVSFGVAFSPFLFFCWLDLP